MATVKLIIPKPVPNKVVLTLSMDEAETLRAIVGRIGGDPRYSRKKYSERILTALQSVGVFQPESVKVSDIYHSIYFLPEDQEGQDD